MAKNYRSGAVIDCRTTDNDNNKMPSAERQMAFYCYFAAFWAKLVLTSLS